MLSLLAISASTRSGERERKINISTSFQQTGQQEFSSSPRLSFIGTLTQAAVGWKEREIKGGKRRRKWCKMQPHAPKQEGPKNWKANPINSACDGCCLPMVCVDLRQEYIQLLVCIANLGPGYSSREGPGLCLPWEIRTCFLGGHSLSLLVVVKSSCFNRSSSEAIHCLLLETPKCLLIIIKCIWILAFTM